MSSQRRSSTVLSQAEREAARLPPLLVAAERIAASVALGIHGRRRSGVGEDFWQFRPYQFGDSTQRIDWRRSARADQLFLREREWDAAQSVWIGCDQSASMSYRSQQDLPTKLTRALELSLALASMLVRGGERIALAGKDTHPSQGRAALIQMAQAFGSETPPTLAQAWAAPLAPHARLVLFGDFLDPLDNARPALRRLANIGIVGHLVQILDPAEETLPFEGRLKIEGFENEGNVLLDHVGSVRSHYRHRLNAHRDALARLAHRHGWGFISHHTDQSPRLALLALFQALSATADTSRITGRTIR